VADTTLRIALAQIDPVVGDTEGNARKAREWIERGRDIAADLVVLPELAIPGYPPEDLLLKPHFVAANRAALESVAPAADGVVALVGFADGSDPTHNALAVLAEGDVAGVYHKVRLPNYGVFDEERYFEPGDIPALIEVDGVLIGLTICEDIWFGGPPASIEAAAGARLIVNASASPYHHGKGTERERMVVERARECGAAFALCNMVGGQDELVFDGHSVIVDAAGATVARAAQFSEELLVCDLPLDAGGPELSEAADMPVIARVTVGARDRPPVPARLAEPPASDEEEEEVYAALCLGLRDYVDKNGFERVLVALSGGIDSALVALVATDALGPERVTCVVMPSPHSSSETQADARRIAANLGADLVEIAIEDVMAAYEEALTESPLPQPAAAMGEPAGVATAVHGTAPGLAEENIQARIRGNLVMALSNRHGWLVLTTGNKSELSVGYATLYGDMAGGFAVIKDVPKTLVYRLVRYRRSLDDRELVPDSVLERPPSAELRPGQRDEDSLPPYDVLDRVLEAYIEGDEGRDEIVARGLSADVVDDVMRKVDAAEYNRRQAPPGIKITPKAFGRDRRMPITNRFGG
jgi:NAD+ synthase (glutamine-hydrolysing)